MGIVINGCYFHIQPLCTNNSLSKYFLVDKYISYGRALNARLMAILSIVFIDQAWA